VHSTKTGHRLDSFPDYLYGEQKIACSERISSGKKRTITIIWEAIRMRPIRGIKKWFISCVWFLKCIKLKIKLFKDEYLVSRETTSID